MKSFTEFLLEGKEEASAIRQVLKSKFGLSSRDVSVTSKYGGYSSSVTVSIKTAKGLPYFNKIEDIGKGQERYEVDQVSQEILAGGNTFVFVQIDRKLEKTLTDSIKKEIEKQSKGNFAEGDRLTLFKTFTVDYYDDRTFIVGAGKGTRETITSQYIDGIPQTLIRLISKVDDGTLYARIK